MANNSKKAAGEVRVVVIECHHIQTDVSNFKSVVQSLTGKKSSAVEGGGESCRKRQRVVAENNFNGGRRFEESSKMIPTTSFKDLDGLLSLHLPSMEDLNWIWTD
ncbi:unnamed protein product [Citrullus colocynthis]|uniref:VQ domain-containing protein n=1 Tax=Citrullus colocynthis TaxID=252529 RepID=A0ABP0YQ87_9ROSI